MFKFALIAAIVYQWVSGADIASATALAHAALRTLCALLLAWMALEGTRVLFLAAMSLDNRPAAARRAGR
jgi:hypothetical protein